MDSDMAMSPQEALNTLDSVCAQVSLSRADHVTVQQATALLQSMLDSQPVVDAQDIVSTDV